MENRAFVSLFSNHTGTLHGASWTIPRPLSLKKKEAPKSDSNPSEQTTKSGTGKGRFYRCKTCNNPVAQQGSECSIGDQNAHSIQVNPHGYLHQVITVHSAFNVLLFGDPVPAASWFPGYLWRFCICIQCKAHIGWSYHLPEQLQYRFVGLRRAGILKD